MRTFRLKILDTIHNGDATEKKEGKPYWTGTKRRPNPAEFSADNALCMEFMYATANLFGRVFGLPAVRDRSRFEAAVRAMNLVQPEWTPSQAAAGANEEGEAEAVVDASDLASLRAALNQVDTRGLQLAHPQSFEKDDDDNFHIDYLTIATNLRAWNYNIKPTERHAVKVTAGRIIPALATTTAMICGLVDIEFCKLVLGLQNLGSHKFFSSNINLATGSEAFSVFTPSKPEAQPMGVFRAGEPLTFTSWDKLEYSEAGRSAAEISAVLAEEFGVVVKAISAETNYRPSKVVPLWTEGQDASKLLSQAFFENIALGLEQSDRSSQNKKRVKSELKKLHAEPVEGLVSIASKADDDYTFQVIAALTPFSVQAFSRILLTYLVAVGKNTRTSGFSL